MLEFVEIKILVQGKESKAEVMNTACGCLFLYEGKLTFINGEKWDQDKQALIINDNMAQADQDKIEPEAAQSETKPDEQKSKTKKKVRKDYVMAEFLDDE